MALSSTLTKHSRSFSGYYNFLDLYPEAKNSVYVLIPEISPWSGLRSHEETNVFKTQVIDQIFSLTRDCLRPIAWLNIPQLKGEYLSDIPQFSKLRVLRKHLKDNKHSSFHLVRNMLGYLS